MTGPASTTGRTRRRSFASFGLTYELVARERGVVLCRGCSGSARKHRAGYVTLWPPRALHWSTTTMTKKGLYRFLKLASILSHTSSVMGVEPWLGLYRQCKIARKTGAQLGVRFPTWWDDRDRARARLWLENDPPTLIEFPEQREIIRRVQAWIRNSGGGSASKVVPPATPTPTDGT